MAYRKKSSGPSGCFAVALAGFAAFFGLVVSVAEATIKYKDTLAMIAGALLALGTAVWAWRIIRGRRLDAYWNAAVALSKDSGASMNSARGVLDLRAKVSKVPPEMEKELDRLYREAVSAAVTDKRVDRTERAGLDAIRKGLSITPEAGRQAEVLGFLQAHAALVGDGRLSEQEEAALAELQAALRVPADAIKAQLDRIDELREARLVGKSAPTPIEVDIRLKNGELCYHSVPFAEMKMRVARSYQSDGVRYTDKELEHQRSGTAYVTSQRILLVSEGTTSLKLPSIFEVRPDADGGVVAITVDGRKTPHYLAVDRPFVTAAHIERALRSL